MKHTIYIFIFFTSTIFSQALIETTFLKKTEFKVDKLISIDNFDTSYFVNHNVFYKKDGTKTITYNNLQLGNLESVNAFNPLKINLFYKDFNTVIILDNRLAEIFKIDFNTLQNYKNITHLSTGFDNTLWIFNQNIQQLELFDYKTRTTRVKTLPVQSQVLDIKSNYNNCWLLTKNYLYVYNYFGSLIQKIKNDGFTNISESNENIILKKEENLFFLKKGTIQITPISIPNFLINQFFVTNETLYIYNDETLHEFLIKTN